MGFFTVVTAAAIVALGLLLATAYRWGRERAIGLRWLLAGLGLAVIAIATFLLPDDLRVLDKFGRGFVMILALEGLVLAIGGLILEDSTSIASKPRVLRAWAGLCGFWLALTLLTGIVTPNLSIGQLNWLGTVLNAPDAPFFVTFIGLTLSGILLVGFAFYDFYKSLMPEVADRALFWSLDVATLMLSMVALSSGAEILIVLGMLTLLVGMGGATYAQSAYRVFDLRSALVAVARILMLIAVTSVVIFAVLVFANRIDLESGYERGIVFAALALVVAAIYVPIRQVFATLFRRIVWDDNSDPAFAARKFSQQVSQAVKLDVLVQTATETLNQLLRVRRSGLILVSRTSEDSVSLSVITGGGFAHLNGVSGAVNTSSPLYQTLAAKHNPLLQFDLEYAPRYRRISDEERQFFRQLQMSAYAPIVVENAFVGILACGPKLNDTPFQREDIEMLSTMAHQTGVALRNARLVVDLQHLNDSMKSLNKGLANAKEELEKLDDVKTDFITIASHELRTPLAQIRGYTDIIDALNTDGLLDQEQITGMVSNLRKATERTEELIAAMLDVSQLDVNAMDLRFAQATVESVVRLAIEPLTDAIKQRKISLEARGLRGLPPIQADMQRLVQAFRNVVVNAIKFTPDGGQIQISAAVQPTKTPDGTEQILVAIQDTGVGIAKENLELIFRKFFRAYDPSLHSTGTYKFLGAGPGLGLTIAKGVIEGHGGKIWAESPGHDLEKFPGSTFYVLLPLNPPESARRVLPFANETKKAPQDTAMRRPR